MVTLFGMISTKPRIALHTLEGQDDEDTLCILNDQDNGIIRHKNLDSILHSLKS